MYKTVVFSSHFAQFRQEGIETSTRTLILTPIEVVEWVTSNGAMVNAMPLEILLLSKPLLIVFGFPRASELNKQFLMGVLAIIPGNFLISRIS